MPVHAFIFRSAEVICLVLNRRPRGGPIETGKVLAVSAVVPCRNPLVCSPDSRGPTLLNRLSVVPHPVVSNCPSRGLTFVSNCPPGGLILNTLLHLQCPISILKWNENNITDIIMRVIGSRRDNRNELRHYCGIVKLHGLSAGMSSVWVEKF